MEVYKRLEISWIKDWHLVSVHPSSFGCMREVAKHERSVRVARGVAECDSSFLTSEEGSEEDSELDTRESESYDAGRC